jgi:hypothetical protein
MTEDERKAENEFHMKELNAKISTMNTDTLGIVLNVNCFIDGSECDVDPVVALKDEESARSLADFLYKQAVVEITERIRTADYSPLDNLALVDLLHQHGINMRYLGNS